MSDASIEHSPIKLLVGRIAIPVSFCALVAILFLPLQGLTPAGQAMLGILAMAVILWVTEAMAYPISALLIALLMTLFLGLTPNPDTGSIIGTSKAILQAMKGFSSPSIIVISGALIMAAAMQATELDRRIARAILSRVHPSPAAILAGCLLIGVVFSFLVPSPTGRTAVQIPILAGVVATLGLGEKSRFAAILVIGAAQVSTIWNVGVMTATGHNVAGLELMAEHSGYSLTWAKWLLYAGPWSALMTIVLFLILRRELRGVNFDSDTGILADSREPLNRQQMRLALFTLILITSWITEGFLHHITVPATMLIMAVCLLLPGLGVFKNWKDVEKRLPWGVIVMFGVSISLGQQLVSTGAAAWLAESCFSALDISSFSIPLLVVVMTSFSIIMHLGFASAMSVTVALLPVFLAFSSTLPPSMSENAMGLVLLQLFAVSFGMILPVNAPQNMVAYSTGSFDTKTFARIGLQLTAASLLTFALFAATWWKWTGLLV
ncbi:SLC13 family permease [Endozoicomonas montiporae]|uniref:Sodium/di-and tricarboxylate cotransporter n=1 Tax=Endozoicomonas montiporae CL-33 TaxID=570277 RepID=A0A142B6Z7_9GAMM|nr:SLC13 family permease [Endozoicomonas montiporae]AMO54523.1 sodium/di- and tricarboxylate cotransporter [Endozoicomonas montiporae CL-33]